MTTPGSVPGVSVPDDLTELDRWGVWRLEAGAKVPYRSRGGRASTTCERDWGALERARGALARGRYSGLAFAFFSQDGLAGIDLDDCLDAGGNVKEWARGIIEGFSDTYMETSPSGNGVKIWARGSLPANVAKVKVGDGGIELYDHGRYFTFTGRVFRGAPLQVEDHTSDIRALYDRLTAGRQKTWKLQPLEKPPAAKKQRACPVPETLIEGWRNNGLCSYAGSLRARGFDPPEILVALQETNRAVCIPPLPDFEVRNIAKSAARWKPFPTARGHAHRAPAIPKGCFDPRPEVCGFHPGEVVLTDRTLKLRRRHAELFAFLAECFGPFGCHPAQETIGRVMRTARQQIARDLGPLVRAGLILVEPGAYSSANQKYACSSYHFVRHEIFKAHFTRRGLPVFNDLGDFAQQFQKADSETKPHISQATDRFVCFQEDAAKRATRVAVVPISALPCDVSDQKKEPASTTTIGVNRVSLPDPVGFWISRYFECANRCGGSRIEFADGTRKVFECSCDCSRRAKTTRRAA